jgi:hypothetical protein
LQPYEAKVSRLEERRVVLEQRIQSITDSSLAPDWPTKVPLVSMNDTKTPKAGPPPVVVVKKTDKPTHKPETPKPEMPKPEIPKPETPAPPAPMPETPPVPHKTRVTQYATAFAISPTLAVTASAPLKGATEIQLLSAEGMPIKAEVVKVDEQAGLALLRSTTHKLSPLCLAAGFNGGAVKCLAFPSIDIFSPTAEFIDGNASKPAADWKINLSRHPRLPGAPILCNDEVVGVVLATRDADAKALPSIGIETLRQFLADAKLDGIGGNNPTRALLQLMTVREVVTE